jgi:signal transduction histidine kinase
MKVLVAEDDPVSKRRVENCLQKWGYEYALASDGAEAWQLFEHGDFSIVISDWMMPEVDGVELVRRIRSDARPLYVYVILLTAKAQKEDLVIGMEAGADDFLTKPFDREELRVRLRAGDRVIRLERSLAEQNRALREAQAALVQSEKLASLGRLAAGVAHEVNNPIAFVANNFVVLRRDMQAALNALDAYRQGRAWEGKRLEKDADLEYFQQNFAQTCDRTLAGLQRVREIVRNLRDFARLDEAECKDINVNAALQSTLDVLRHEFGAKAIQVDPDLQPLPSCLCHPGKINQVFLHLLTNAVQACAHGGTVTARTRHTDKEIIVEIQDNGCGIAPEDRPRIFEPFFTTQPIGQGIGLGLANSYAIIRDHGGVIEVDSEPGRGSLFRIRLPVQSVKPGE